MGGDAIERRSHDNTSIEPIFHRTYQVVVAATPDMGIGKYENVISCGSMSSALKSLPQPPYSISIEKVFLIGGGQILLSHLQFLSSTFCLAYCYMESKGKTNKMSMGAGRHLMLWNVMPIHITEINTSFECDTFIPPIDISIYQPWYSSSPVEEIASRIVFATYVRLKTSTSGPVNSGHELRCNGSTSRSKRFKLSDFTYLPKIIFEKHEEFQY
ncbi:Bifunctional dihydrofolate reductase-thymidylate synthase [Sesamum alatum]|uniref:dihydrofolate reductase n=1 Tax=Sesamum alatum TaxID=300844 RepID=A0AAE1XSB5_9LAMI|nr:Bifunctional dihydrofolate reductase-thymidylate synthase [Sesamum alatum]